MTEYESLKKVQKKHGRALACSFKKNGEMLIFVTADADDEEVMASLIQVAIEVSKYRGKIKG